MGGLGLSISARACGGAGPDRHDAFGNIVAQLHPTSGVVGSLFDNPILFASREFVAETQLGR